MTQIKDLELNEAFIDTFQYVESEACMMELRFAVCNMGLPLVVVVVGTGKKWKKGEVSIVWIYYNILM